MYDIQEKLSTYLQNNDDYRKCDEYIYKIRLGDYSTTNEANLFVLKKYDEFCKKDKDLAMKFGITKISNITVNNSNVTFSVIVGLISIKQLIDGKLYKDE